MSKSAQANEKKKNTAANATETGSKKRPGRTAQSAAQLDTSICMVESVRKYLSRNNKVVSQEVLRLIREANLETDVVPQVRTGRVRQTEEGSKRRNIRFPVELHEKFKKLGGSSWLKVAVEKEMSMSKAA